MQTLLLAHGGNDILKNVFGFLYILCKTDCSTQNFTSLKHLISKTDITAIKYSGQGSFKVNKGAIDNFFFIFTENHRHLPIASVNDPLSDCSSLNPHLRTVLPVTSHKPKSIPGNY